MPGTASFSSATATRTATTTRQQHRSSVTKNNKGHSEAGVWVWDAPPSVDDDARRRRPRNESSVQRQRHPEDPQQQLLSSLLRDLSFWEVPQHPHEKPPTRRDGPSGSTSETVIRASNQPRDVPSGGATSGGGMLSAPRSGLLSRSGQRVAAMPDDGGSHGPEENDKLGMAGLGASNPPLRRQQQQQPSNGYGGDAATEEEKVDTMASTTTTSSSSHHSKTASSSSSTRVWKSAVDPASGRTYYYDAATRQTQWEKPEEVRAEERRIKKEKRRLEQIFFEEVRANVLASLARGELIPGVPRNETTNQGPPLEPVLSPTSSLASLSPTSPQNDSISSSQRRIEGNRQSDSHFRQSQQQMQSRGSSGSSNARIRTISGMNEKLLAELHNPPPSIASNNAARSVVPRLPPPVPNPAAAAAAAPTTASMPLSTIEGRPPLPRGRSLPQRDDRATNVVPSAQHLPAPTSQQAKPNDHHFVAQDSLELSPDPVVHHKQRAAADGAAIGSGDARRAAHVANEAAELEGERLLDAPIFGGEVAKVAASASAPSSASAAAEKQRKGEEGASLSASSHMRRNTGGTVFVQSTMENPNIKATIKCVCGVYRAHVVSSSSSSANAPPSRDSLTAAAFEIFRDETHRDYRRIVSQNAVPCPPIPSLHEIETFYFDFYRRSQMEQDTIIMSLIYVERLIKETNGTLTPSPWNWKSILFSCMVLSSKVWDDLSMFNLDFSNVSMAVSTSQSVSSATGAAPAPASSSSLSSFSLQRTNALEVALLQTLNFNVRVAASEYAKYYFLIRTMLLRSGLLNESNGENQSADKKGLTDLPCSDDGQRLESRSSQYQAQLQRRAKSVDWTFGSASSMSEPVLKDSVCLEQLLANQRS